MNAAAQRIRQHSPNVASHLQSTEALEALLTHLDASPGDLPLPVWHFVETSLPALLESSADQLSAWHDA